MTLSSLRLLGLLACGLSLVAAGCGVDVSQVFASADNGTSGGGPGGQGGTGGDGAGGSSTTTTGEGNSTSTSSTSTTSSGSTTTSSITTTSTTSSTSSTTTTSTVSSFTLQCGAGTCSGNSEICCWDEYGTNGPQNTGECFDAPVSPFDCDNSLSQDGAQSIIACQKPAHCTGGQVCCGQRVFFNGGASAFYELVTCEDSCDYPDLVLCNGQGDDTGCPVVNVNGQTIQTTCTPSGLLPMGYFICSAQ